MVILKDFMILLLNKVGGGVYEINFLKIIFKSFYSNYNVFDVLRFVSVVRMFEEFLLDVVASDVGLSVEMFKVFGEIMFVVFCDVLRYFDGIYRVVDVFLERYRDDLIEIEKMEVCRVFDCKKFLFEVCEYVLKNEKFLLRIVV